MPRARDAALLALALAAHALCAPPPVPAPASRARRAAADELDSGETSTAKEPAAPEQTRAEPRGGGGGAEPRGGGGGAEPRGGGGGAEPRGGGGGAALPASVYVDIFGTPPPAAAGQPGRAPSASAGRELSTSAPPPAAPAAPAAPAPYDGDDDDDDDDDDLEPMNASPTGGGSNLFSLLRLAGALLPGSSGGNPFLLRNLFRDFVLPYREPLYLRDQGSSFLRRSDGNEVDSDLARMKPPPAPTPRRQETAESDSEATSESDEGSDEDTDEDTGAEESVESGPGGGSNKQASASDASRGSDSDYELDEPPGGGDGQGGGVLGVLAGLSGGEDGQSDLGSLLAAVSGIVVNLSGDGIDVNALIASGLGLFVGLLSEGNENPGAVLASYLLTSLDSLSGGGSKNNGAFFGSFLSKLVKGTSAAPEGSEESAEGAEPTKDSGGFLLSFLAGLLGDMSAGSSGGKPEQRAAQQPAPPPARDHAAMQSRQR